MKFKSMLIFAVYLSQISATLHKESKIPIIQQTFTKLNTVLERNYSELALTEYARKIVNPYKHYLADEFIQNDKLIYLPGACIEKNDSIIDLHILNLESCLKAPAAFLAELILSQNADVVCIQDMDTHYAHDLYKHLQNTYSHFLYMNPFPTRQESLPNGFLIASKHPMENAQFSPFEDQKNNEGCLDFIIKNKNTPIGHIYLAHLQKDLETQTLKFLETVEKMELDFLNAKEQIPFVLCGKLSLLEDSEEDFHFLSDYSQVAFTDMESLILTSIRAVEDNNLPSK